MIKLLLKHGANPDIKDANGDAPIHEAILNGSKEIVETLLDCGANIEAMSGSYRRTPLLLAIGISSRSGSMAIIKLLVQRGADLNCIDGDDRSALDLAAKFANEEVVNFLLDVGCPLDDVVAQARREHTHKMGGRGWWQGFNYDSLLQTAALKGYTRLLVALAPIADLQNTQPDGNGQILHRTALKGRSESLEIILAFGADPNIRTTKGYLTPLHSAVLSFDEATVQILLDYGADINACNEHGKTPISYLINQETPPGERWPSSQPLEEMPGKKGPPITPERAKRILSIVQQLIRNGADLSIKDYDEKTALYYAKLEEITMVVDILSDNQMIEQLRSQAPSSKNRAGPITKTPIAKYQNHPRSPPSSPSGLRDNLNPDVITPKSKEKSRTRSYSPGRLLSLPRKGTADAWFSDYQKFTEPLQAHTPDTDNYERVRVAIIDSGVIPEHPHSYAVKDYQDFVDDDHDTRKDNTQHGSTGLHLVATIAPEVDVYIARVFRSEAADSTTPEAITKAIKHAMDVWRVDVITLACGFEENHENMQQVIQRASDSGILIFAAASNEGNRRGIMFPARLQGRVMCMFACDGNSKISTVDFNPSPSRYQRNFAFPGKDVQAMLGAARVHGTSIATFIGAAVAAEIIDFSRQDGIEDGIGDLELLRTVSGMSRVFEQMSVEDSDYHCVIPLKAMRSTILLLSSKSPIFTFKK
ncbi:hypothetical protein TWF694_007183 [Orbilia ellipsospora]|uniref:Peptidase S8/S53 domain-containing protein n=1 Tax=Orbilia ellipsospora TaxID=2528407 RepID=A0AAV9XH01_9PEZI